MWGCELKTLGGRKYPEGDSGVCVYTHERKGDSKGAG